MYTAVIALSPFHGFYIKITYLVHAVKKYSVMIFFMSIYIDILANKYSHTGLFTNAVIREIFDFLSNFRIFNVF